MPLLCDNLSREEGRKVSEEEVAEWLRCAGFTPSAGGWTVREADLGQLDPTEVISAEVVVSGSIEINRQAWLGGRVAAAGGRAGAARRLRQRRR